MALPVADFYSCASGGTIVAGRTSGVPAWVQALPLHHWYSIPNTALASIEPSPKPPGDPQCKISAWNGACVRYSDSAYIIPPSGGHGDYAGNEIGMLKLSDAVPAWVQVKPPSATSDMILSAVAYLDLRRSAGHTYNGAQFDQVNNRILMVSTGTTFGSIGSIPARPADWPWISANGTFMAFDMVANEWLAPGALTPFPTGSTLEGQVICVNRLTGDVYANKPANGYLWRYRPSTNTWTNVGAWYMSGTEAYCGQDIDYTRDRMLVVGDYFGTRAPFVRSSIDGSAVSATFGGLGPDVLKSDIHPAVEYDNVNDCFWVCINGSPIEVYRVNASTWYVDQPTITGTKPAARTNGIHNSFRYVPNLKGVVLANDYFGNVKFMRTAL
jgi:hypothetical protein